ncbi:GumC family protein [Ruegeria marina]|uniref:non-specific protein-tyrosine kinase n=1 Tax=Ruegeria marina TaxID=639004 RepID=A0A1G6IBL1_9RHOB|nr:polysaccharide biosynthesis tyrosine autokinase [Ruegeria marina]SDC03929.1 capsular exopolysaccharide family [Ruegeria marina]
MNSHQQSKRVSGYDYGEQPAFDHGYQPLHTIDLWGLFSVLRVNLKLIVAITLACVIGMFVYLQTLPPIYTAYAQVILDTREERVTPVQEVMSNLNVTNSVVAGEIVTIRSNILVGQVVDEMRLVDAPEFDPRVPRGESPMGFVKRVLRRGEKPHEVAARLPEETLRSWVIDALRRKMSVSQIGVSYAIGISVENGNPKLAADIANAIAAKYIDSQLDAKMQATLRANSWLGERLTELSAQVEDADAAVVRFKAEMIDTAGGNEESINQLLAELNTKLVGSSTERADAEVRLSQVEALENSGGLESVAFVLTSPLLETLQRQRAELAASKAQMASTLGRRHPDMIRITAQIADIDRSIETELRRRIEEMRSDVSVTQNREDALRLQIEAVSERADSLAKDSVRLGQLERTAQATRLVYENFLARYKETSAQADYQTPEARVIGAATVPSVPSGPRKTMMMIASVVLGGAIAVAVVFIRNLVRAPVTTATELRALTQLPTLASLPYVGGIFDRKRWLKRELATERGSPFLERIRSIRTHLYNASLNSEPKVIMITSSVPDEGKTSLSCALAKVLAQPKKKVLLLDGDLRRPDIRIALGLPLEGGCLIDYLERKVKFTEIVQTSELLGADVISPAKSANNAADLLASNDFSGLLTRMSAKYDVIIMNAPPVLHLSDTILLGNLADATLLAVQCDKTPSDVVSVSLKHLQKSSKAPVVGTVLTMVRRSHAARNELEMYSYEY